MSIHFTKELLESILKRDDAVLIGEYDRPVPPENLLKIGHSSGMETGDASVACRHRLNRDSRISFRCRCGQEDIRGFRNIVQKGGFCKKCVYAVALEKRKGTLMKTLGVEYISQAAAIKEKTKNTNLEKWGGTAPSACEAVRAKMKETNLEKYGVEHPLQNKDVMEKVKSTCKKKYGTECALACASVKEKIVNTLQEKYGEGILNPFQAEDVKEKIKQTHLRVLGVEYPGQADVVKAKIRETNMERLGVEYPGKSESVKRKSKDTNLVKYGTEYTFQSPDVKEKIKVSLLDKYGVTSPLQNEVIYAKMKETNMEKYGTEFPMQNTEVFQKSVKRAFRRKECTLPSGAVRMYQGYENVALLELVKTFREDQILNDIKEMPDIRYEYMDKKRRYYPDIYIPDEKKIIEVKSRYTYSFKLEQNLCKKKAVEEAGFTFEFWICSKKGLLEKR